MKQSASLIFLVLALVLFGGHFAKGQQEESDEVDADSAVDVDEQNGTNQPSTDGNRVGRIVGGVPATSATQLYAVVMNTVTTAGVFYLSGAAISNTTVLTSASALRSAGNITTLGIGAGSSPVIRKATVYFHQSIEVNSGFNPTTLENDVAIVTINGTFAGVPNVQPIAIATAGIAVSPTNRPQCVVAGWGQTANGGTTGNLTEIVYELMTDQECSAGGANPPSIVCARPTGVGFACNMDSGAPLVCNGQLYGILTDQTGCKTSSPPTMQKFAKLPVIFPPPAPAPTPAAPLRKNYVSCS